MAVGRFRRQVQKITAHPKELTMRSVRLAVTILVVVSFVTLSFAQTATSSLRGTVTDPKGGLVVGATVKLTDPAHGGGREAKTNNTGEYDFEQVPPGVYDVTATAPNVGAITQK